MTRHALAVLLTLSLSGLAACGKKEPPPPPATAAPAPAPAPEPTSARDICKKKFATACAIPCQTKAAQVEKDEQKLKLAKDRCMISCLEQAETACPKVK